MGKKKDKFDPVRFMLDYETSDMTDAQLDEGFQHLLDDGTVWQLQANYQRMANHLITEQRIFIRENA